MICSIALLLVHHGIRSHCLAVDINPAAVQCSHATLAAHKVYSWSSAIRVAADTTKNSNVTGIPAGGKCGFDQLRPTPAIAAATARQSRPAGQSYALCSLLYRSLLHTAQGQHRPGCRCLTHLMYLPQMMRYIIRASHKPGQVACEEEWSLTGYCLWQVLQCW